MGAIQIIAHRGASHAYAENTRAAFDQALHENADGIELDLQLTADGVPVIFHDDRLHKLGHPRARIRDFTLAQLRKMDVGQWFGREPAQLLSLPEMLDEYADKTKLYLEIKHTERNPARHRQLAQTTAKCISDCPDALGISVLSFHWKALALILDRLPEIECVRNIDIPWGAPMLRRYLPSLSGVCINVDTFGTRHAATLAALNKPLFSYTCDTPKQLAHARTLGVTRIITNNPEQSRAWFELQNADSN